jgi:hypothetical protein
MQPFICAFHPLIHACMRAFDHPFIHSRIGATRRPIQRTARSVHVHLNTSNLAATHLAPRTPIHMLSPYIHDFQQAIRAEQLSYNPCSVGDRSRRRVYIAPVSRLGSGGLTSRRANGVSTTRVDGAQIVFHINDS